MLRGTPHIKIYSIQEPGSYIIPQGSMIGVNSYGTVNIYFIEDLENLSQNFPTKITIENTYALEAIGLYSLIEGAAKATVKLEVSLSGFKELVTNEFSEYIGYYSPQKITSTYTTMIPEYPELFIVADPAMQLMLSSISEQNYHIYKILGQNDNLPSVEKKLLTNVLSNNLGIKNSLINGTNFNIQENHDLLTESATIIDLVDYSIKHNTKNSDTKEITAFFNSPNITEEIEWNFPKNIFSLSDSQNITYYGVASNDSPTLYVHENDQHQFYNDKGFPMFIICASIAIFLWIQTSNDHGYEQIT